jgi:monoamine oxidase
MTLHVIGAGLAGLSCALSAADAGHAVVVHEAAGRAGGRCRSWVEPGLDRLIDNGTHMVVGGNQAVFGYLRRIGASAELVATSAAFPMLDLADGRLWTVTPTRLLPSLIAAAWRTYQAEDKDIAGCLGTSRHYRCFWEPLSVAVMNTPAASASVQVFRRVLARTLWRGMAASTPFLVRRSLADTFVQPALAALAAAGVELRLHHPLRRLHLVGSHAARLEFSDQTVDLGDDDAVVLAVPWAVAASLLPGIPDLPASPIVNAHYRLDAPLPRPATGNTLGLVGGVGQWLFLRDDVLSVTVSAAGELAERSVDDIADQLWAEAARALAITKPPLARRVIKEKRATLFHSPAVEARRPAPKVGDNLVLAGDWTATGLPCTLESAVRSGLVAAKTIGR